MSATSIATPVIGKTILTGVPTQCRKARTSIAQTHERSTAAEVLSLARFWINGRHMCKSKAQGKPNTMSATPRLNDDGGMVCQGSTRNMCSCSGIGKKPSSCSASRRREMSGFEEANRSSMAWANCTSKKGCTRGSTVVLSSLAKEASKSDRRNVWSGPASTSLFFSAVLSRSIRMLQDTEDDEPRT